jgi:hypothetical protein
MRKGVDLFITIKYIIICFYYILTIVNIHLINIMRFLGNQGAQGWIITANNNVMFLYVKNIIIYYY